MHHVNYVLRGLPQARKVNPSDQTKNAFNTTNTPISINDSLQSMSPMYNSSSQWYVGNSSDNLHKSPIKSSPQNLPTETKDQNKPKQSKSVRDRFRNWFNGLTSKQKIIFGLICAGLSILVVAIIIIPPIYVYVIRHNSSSSTKATSSCSTLTCIGKETSYHSSIVTAFYPFDGSINDLSGSYSGTFFGSSGPYYTTTAYFGSAITFSAGAQSYVRIPNIDFSKQSFTLQSWFLLTNGNLSNEYPIFCQCDSNSICLLLAVRNSHLIFSFDAMNSNGFILTGVTSVNSYEWIHITAVYDATLFQQQLYINGHIDAVSMGVVNTFQGTTTGAATTIAKGSSYTYGITYFVGRIDQFTISAGTARNLWQILNDASLLVYYPFDTYGTFNDYSVNLCNAIGIDTTAVSSGAVNQAISFLLNTSYVQAQCFPKLRNTDVAFSFSLWINPSSSSAGGTLIHISLNSYGNSTCYDLLALNGTAALVYQLMITNTSVSNVQGPTISVNSWTHIAIIYSYKNGMSLYINGQFFTASPITGNLFLVDSPIPWYVTLGNVGSSAVVNCLSGSIPIVSGPFQGMIDEFRIYNRELNSQEICVLANP